MGHYLLSVHSVDGGPPTDMTPAEMQASMAAIEALEAEMRAAGSFVFSARLTEPAAARVVHGSGLSMTDGPFAEAKEQIAGFYVVEASDHGEALLWAEKVVDCIGSPIEVRPFFAGAGLDAS